MHAADRVVQIPQSQPESDRPLPKLPLELLVQIFSELDGYSRWHGAQVSRTWRKAGKAPSLQNWEALELQDFGPNVGTKIPDPTLGGLPEALKLAASARERYFLIHAFLRRSGEQWKIAATKIGCVAFLERKVGSHNTITGVELRELAFVAGRHCQTDVLTLLHSRFGYEYDDGSNPRALHLAAYFHDWEGVRLILPSCRHQLTNTDRYRIFRWAICGGQTELAQMMVDDSGDSYALLTKEALIDATQFGQIDSIKFLLERGQASLASLLDRTLLACAVHYDQGTVLRYFLEEASLPERFVTGLPETRADICAAWGKWECARYLVRRFAAGLTEPPGPSVDERRRHFYVASQCGDVETMLCILSSSLGQGTFAMKLRRSELAHALALAASTRRRDALSLLIQYRADPNCANESGFTPLHIAAQVYRNSFVVKQLLEAGASPDIRSTGEKRCALAYAKETGDKRMIATLLKASTGKELFVTPRGATPSRSSGVKRPLRRRKAKTQASTRHKKKPRGAKESEHGS